MLANILEHEEREKGEKRWRGGGKKRERKRKEEKKGGREGGRQASALKTESASVR